MKRLSSAERAIVSHAAPFAAWLLVMTALGEPAGWKYAVRVAVSLGILLWLKPWTAYPKPQGRHVLLALQTGIVVFLVWVVPESGLLSAWPRVQEFYVRYAVFPWGKLREAPPGLPYAPEICGWPLAIIRLLGSGLVISVIEEFFWRGFLYRWMQGRDFTAVDPGRRDLQAWLLVSVVFGFEHQEWLAGLIAGCAYGWVHIRTRDLWAACTAHAVTNLLLGVYVLSTGAWFFW